MQITLAQREECHAVAFWHAAQAEHIRRMLPLTAASPEEAAMQWRRSQQPGATSCGRIILADGRYVGDVWCYGIDPDDTPQAMLSYCIFDPASTGKGVATQAVRMFLQEIRSRFSISTVGAFTYADNAASIRVLEKCGFIQQEAFTEDDRESLYYETK